ncbi:MAG: GNAT family N-acetyltransferase [Deltaproteobacteria bacterium]|nr:GNAT family N-acetyltransferase [Deltaproteobacteria bacterium]
MAAEIEIRPLREDDDRRDFSCGQPDLDRFFQYYAGQNQFRFHISVTYVAAAGNRIVGFATVAAGSILTDQLPSARLKRSLPGYPLPVLRLARLAVDRRVQRAGVGAALMRHILHRALDQRNELGCIGVVTDAKPEAVSFYERYDFVAINGILEGAMHASPIPMFLPIATVAASTMG